MISKEHILDEIILDFAFWENENALLYTALPRKQCAAPSWKTDFSEGVSHVLTCFTSGFERSSG